MGMLVAVLTTIIDMQLASGGMNWELIIAGLVVGSVIGIIMAIKVEMTGMPELVALFNGFGGAASALVALSETWKYIESPDLPLPTGLELEVVVIAAGLSALVGWMTLTGSILAMFKLKGGIEVFGKWFSTPTWGPSWLNPVKVILTVSVLALIVLSINDPETPITSGPSSVSLACLVSFWFFPSVEQTCRWSFRCSTPFRESQQPLRASSSATPSLSSQVHSSVLLD